MVKTETINEFGLKESTFNWIIKGIKQFPQIERAIIYGSRAKGNYENGSDIDLAIAGDGISFDIVTKLSGLLNEEFPIPHHLDIVDFTHLKHQNLKDHIQRIGKQIYARN